jgi:glycosyltransferase involved in cell wall biosynthesis
MAEVRSDVLMTEGGDRTGPVLARRFLRILVVCYEWPPLGGGGGRVAADIARGLARRGHEVRTVTSALRGLPANETVNGVSIHRRRAGRSRADGCTVPEMGSYVLAHSLPLLFECLRFRPDVVHVHFAVPSGAVAWFATRFTRTPYVLTAHLGDVPGGVPEQTDHLFHIVKPFTVPIWRSAAAVTAVAPHVAELAERAYGIKPRVILNGSDAVIFRRSVDPVGGGPLRVVWCGRIQQQKNLGAALASLSSIAGRPWTLDILGDGPLRSEAEECCRAAKLTQQIRFHGWLAPDRVAAEFGKADVLFLPSITEGLSLVTIEALRAGLAFVASRIPGIADVVVDGLNGILCDSRSPAYFAAAISCLIEDRAMLHSMQAASAERASLFGTDQMVNAYEEVLSSVAQGSTRR